MEVITKREDYQERLIEPERNLGIAGYPWALSLDEVETELAALAEWGWTEKRARER